MWQLTISVNHSSKETHYYMYLHSLPSTGRYNYTVLWYTFIAYNPPMLTRHCFRTKMTMDRLLLSWSKETSVQEILNKMKQKLYIYWLLKIKGIIRNINSVDIKMKTLHCFSFINLYIVLLSCFENNRFRGTCTWLGIHVLLVI